MNKLLLLLLLLFSHYVLAEPPTIQYDMSQSKNWKKDTSQVIHIGTKCSGIFDAVIWRLSSDKRPKMLEMTKKYRMYGDVFMYTTGALAEKTGVSSEFFTKKYKYWMDLYKAQGEQNHIKYNDFFQGQLGDDFKTCSGIVPFFETLLTAMAKEKN